MTALQAQKRLLMIFESYGETRNASDGDYEAVAMAISALSMLPSSGSVNDNILSGRGLNPLDNGNPALMVTPSAIPTKRR